jgi:hypothetical protein
MHLPSPRVPNIIQQSCRIKSSHSSILVDEKCTRPLQLRVEEFYLFTFFLFVSFCCVLFLPRLLRLLFFTPRDYPQPTPFPYT